MVIDHHLKCRPDYWADLDAGTKTFSLRFDDKNYRVGDYLRIYRGVEDDYRSKEPLDFQVTHVFNEFGVVHGFVILSLRKL